MDCEIRVSVDAIFKTASSRIEEEQAIDMARLKQVSFEQICEEAEQFKTDLLMPEGTHLHQVPFNKAYIQMLWYEGA